MFDFSLALSLSVPFHWFNFGFHTSNMWRYIRCNIESTRHCHSQLQYCIYRLFLKIRLHLFFIRFVIAFWQLKEERRTGEKKLFNCIYLCVCWHPIYLSLYGRRIGSIHFPYFTFIVSVEAINFGYKKLHVSPPKPFHTKPPNKTVSIHRSVPMP